MKILIAPDSFKESLSAVEVAANLAIGIKQVLPEAECIEMPMADGGEGTVEALVKATGGEIVSVKAFDPLMRETKSFYGLLGDGSTAVIEMAAASGLELLSEDERNPLITTTFGTGQLIIEALDMGIRKIILGLGGSATNDGGAGMAEALGVKFLDKNGRLIPKGGGELLNIDEIDDSQMDPRIKECQFIIASDVNNVLYGKKGAAQVFGPQKGADEKAVNILDNALENFGTRLEEKYNRQIIDVPGSGAAGGLGAGLLAFCAAEIKSGFKLIADTIRLEDAVNKVDLVITGEGKMDRQTQYGKTPAGVAELARNANIPVIGIAGSLGKDYQELYNFGFDLILSIQESPVPLTFALENANKLIQSTGNRIGRIIRFKLIK